MEQIYDWNEYCEMLADLEREDGIPEEEAAYHEWLQRETERFDSENLGEDRGY